MFKKLKNKEGSILGVMMVIMVTLTLFGYGLINLSAVNAVEVTQAVHNIQLFGRVKLVWLLVLIERYRIPVTQVMAVVKHLEMVVLV